MPATTIHELLNFRPVIETAVLAVLETATGGTGARTQGTDSKTSPRFEIEYNKGQTMGHLYEFGGTCYHDMYKGSLRVRVVTVRQDDGQTATHADYVGKVVQALTPGIGNFTTDNLPYHQLADLRLSDAAFSADDENDQDVTELSYTAVAGIRVEGWAATLAGSGFTYRRPGGIDTYLRPDGTSQYLRP